MVFCKEQANKQTKTNQINSSNKKIRLQKFNLAGETFGK